MIPSYEMVLAKSAELLQQIPTKRCKICSGEFEIVGTDYIVGRCTKCKSTAGRFVCRTCCKSENELDRAITTIIRLWNTKNSSS